MARFVLAHPIRQRRQCRRQPRLHVDADHPVARRIAAQAHGDLLVLERTINEKTSKLRQDIQVDDVRRTVTFFGSTPGEGGWRVAIVDAVDELNREGANALLKVLEEPPRRALLLLVSHSPAPRPADHPLALPAAGVAAARPKATWRAPPRPRSAKAPTLRRSREPPRWRRAACAGARLSRRRCARAAQRHRGAARAAAVGRSARAACARRSSLRHRSGDARGLRRYRECLAFGAAGRRNGGHPPASTGWRRPGRRSTRPRARSLNYNLDRKPLVFNVFGWLAEAARG